MTTRIFFSCPLRRRGRNARNTRVVPTTLNSNSRTNSFRSLRRMSVTFLRFWTLDDEQFFKGFHGVVRNACVANEVIEAVGEDTAGGFSSRSNGRLFGHVEIDEVEAAVGILGRKILEAAGTGGVSSSCHNDIVFVLELFAGQLVYVVKNKPHD